VEPPKPRWPTSGGGSIGRRYSPMSARLATKKQPPSVRNERNLWIADCRLQIDDWKTYLSIINLQSAI
jgi:hypothetical protein